MKNMKCRATLSYVYHLGDQVVHHVTRSNFVETEYREVIIKAKKFANCSFFKPGDIITYTLVLTNVGSFEASSIRIVDEIPHQTLLNESISLRSLDDVKYAFKQEDALITFELDHLTPHDTVYISYQCFVEEGLEIGVELNNHATVSVDEELNITTNKIEMTQRYAKLACEKRFASVVYPNKSFDYFVDIENTGNVEAIDLEVTDQLLENYILESIKIDEKETEDYTIENSILKFKLHTLAPFSKSVVKVSGFIKRKDSQ